MIAPTDIAVTTSVTGRAEENPVAGKLDSGCAGVSSEPGTLSGIVATSPEAGSDPYALRSRSYSPTAPEVYVSAAKVNRNIVPAAIVPPQPM